jgi:hypothetical protein
LIKSIFKGLSKTVESISINVVGIWTQVFIVFEEHYTFSRYDKRFMSFLFEK